MWPNRSAPGQLGVRKLSGQLDGLWIGHKTQYCRSGFKLVELLQERRYGQQCRPAAAGTKESTLTAAAHMV